MLSKKYRTRLMELSGIKNKNYITIPKGHKLFHGTSENFDIKNARVGGYDKVFWTSEDSAIAQTYIPVSGGYIYLSSSSLSKPTLDGNLKKMQEQLGIDYLDVEGNRNNVTSYREAPIFKEVSDLYYETYKKMFDLTKKLEDTKKERYEKWDNLTREEKLEWAKKEFKIEEELKNKEKEYHSLKLEKIKNEYVNKKLRQLGYKPTDDYDTINKNFNWKVKTKINKILPSDYRVKGRLLIIEPKEDLKIFDLTYGGTRESDLTNLDYHELELFQKLEINGYDGIKITDFAQIETEGNFGHYSIGLFKNAIPKLKIDEIEAVHPKDFGENHYKTRDYQSKEYKDYVSGKIKSNK